MTQRELSSDRAGNKANEAKHEASPWIIALGRFGYAAKGIVYALIGVLAFQAAIGTGGQTTDSQGALRQIAQAPLGQVLLGLIAVGLFGYAIWRFAQAAFDTENKGDDAKGLITRAAYAIVGLIYIGLAVTAIGIIMGSSNGSSGEQSTQSRTAWLLSQPFGQWLVGIVGAMVIGFGLFQLYRAYSAKFREELKLSEMSRTEEKWATRAGRMGFGARGIVFGVIGTFLIVAAIQAQPQEARGLAGALDTLARQPWGWIVLGIVAIGLIAYGIYCEVEARYRRMVIR